MHIGCSPVSGGVRLKLSHESFKFYPNLVIFQQPRPGPLLPKGEHYMTIGWKQVSNRKTTCVLFTFRVELLDLGSA